MLAGRLLAPFTVDASAVLTVGSAVAGVAGGVTSAGASITNISISKSGCESAQASVEEDKKITEKLIDIIKTFSELCEKLDSFVVDHDCGKLNVVAISKIILAGGFKLMLPKTVKTIIHQIKALKHMTPACGARKTALSVTGQTA